MKVLGDFSEEHVCSLYILNFFYFVMRKRHAKCWVCRFSFFKKNPSSSFAKSYICELTQKSCDSWILIIKGNTKNGQRQLFIWDKLSWLIGTTCSGKILARRYICKFRPYWRNLKVCKNRFQFFSPKVLSILVLFFFLWNSEDHACFTFY